MHIVATLLEGQGPFWSTLDIDFVIAPRTGKAETAITAPKGKMAFDMKCTRRLPPPFSVGPLSACGVTSDDEKHELDASRRLPPPRKVWRCKKVGHGSVGIGLGGKPGSREISIRSGR